jgi:hypothetical protein
MEKRKTKGTMSFHEFNPWDEEALPNQEEMNQKAIELCDKASALGTKMEEISQQLFALKKQMGWWEHRRRNGWESAYEGDPSIRSQTCVTFSGEDFNEEDVLAWAWAMRNAQTAYRTALHKGNFSHQTPTDRFGNPVKR